jgi:hypothetical protein
MGLGKKIAIGVLGGLGLLWLTRKTGDENKDKAPPKNPEC